MNKLLKSNLVLVIVGGFLYLSVTFGIIMTSVAKFKKMAPINVDPNHIDPFLDGPSWTYVNPDLNELILELKARKEHIKRKEEELKLWELQIQKDLSSLRSITNRVHSIQNHFEQSANTLTNTEETNIKRLLDLFKSLQPAQTATILEPMPDEKIAKIFRCK